jgi:branched-chain amino acid transport system ATP-binding protein
MIEIEDLTVRFGGVTPLDRMTITAGKTTFFNVLSGFVRPATGSVTAFGENLLGMTHFRRARWGLRRTFQTEQAIEELSIFDNVAMVHEHCASEGLGARRDAVLSAIEFVGLEGNPQTKVGTLGAGERRLVELARAVVGHPRVILLDEPAAGLPEQESERTSQVIQKIPNQLGALVILVDHDMSLVSACCSHTAVLDFGKLIASGETRDVLRDDEVKKAYLGGEEVAA